MIPDFVHRLDAPGPLAFLLPTGSHSCTLTEIEQVMVDNFATSRVRHSLFNGLRLYLRDCEAFGLSGRIWLDGSFVTGEVEPQDIDAIVLVAPQSLSRLAWEERAEAFALFDGGEATRTRYDVHAFGAVALPNSDADYGVNARQVAAGLQFFEQTKSFVNEEGQQTRLAKGLLQLDFGVASEVEIVNQWFISVQREPNLWNRKSSLWRS